MKYILTAFFIFGFIFAQDNPVWVFRYGGSGNSEDRLLGSFIDNSGNIYIAGSSEGTPTNTDIFLLKIDSLGQQVWVRTYNGPGNSDDVPSLWHGTLLEISTSQEPQILPANIRGETSSY